MCFWYKCLVARTHLKGFEEEPNISSSDSHGRKNTCEIRFTYVFVSDEGVSCSDFVVVTKKLGEKKSDIKYQVLHFS